MKESYRTIRHRLHEGETHIKAASIGQEPAGRILIFAQGRTGTWLMTHFLNAHPAIHCEKEILMYPKIAPQQYMTARSRLCSAQVYGCHVQINQLLTAQKVDPARFVRGLSAENWQILYLKRNDIVRQSISTILATHRRQWYTYNLAEVDMRPITIPAAELMQWLERRVAHYQLERELLHELPHLPLVYEDDLQNATQHQATMDRVFHYLNLPTIPVEAATKRLSSNNLAKSIINFDELSHAISRSRFAPYTDLC